MPKSNNQPHRKITSAKPNLAPSYDIWADHSLDDFDYQKELTEEYKDLGYNPRNVKPVGKERPQDCQ